MQGDVRWIRVGLNHLENDVANHGTCVLALAVSPVFGVAKKADAAI